MSEIRVTSVVGENGGDRVGLTTGLTVGPLTGTTGIGATISHHGHAQFAGVCTATSLVGNVKTDRIIPTGGVPSGGGGGIIQVVSTNVDSTSTTTLTTQDTFYEITALATTITTVSANSKILVTAGIGGEANHEDYYLTFRCGRVIGGSLTYIFKGADAGSRKSVLAVVDTGHYDNDKNSTPSYQSYPNMLDSPSQAAGTAITYKFFVSSSAGDNASYFLNRTVGDGNSSGYERLFSYMTLMEVSV